MIQGYSECQVYGLYKGYKRRNAELDALEADPPAYLKTSKVPLANQTFEDVQDPETLRTLHSHLFKRYVLTGKVIDARKLHHTHFYSLNIDFGHQAYLDKLSSNRHTILRSLERLERRTADVLYQKEQWFAWVREAQEEEEANREKEQKKIKQEAALFKRHREKLQARLEKARREEEQKSQDAYLEAAFRERMAMSADEWDNDETWDPIKDTGHDKRNQYIDLIKHFLWMDVDDDDADENDQDPPAETRPAAAEAAPAPEAPAEAPAAEDGQKPSKRGKKKAKAKANAANSSDSGHLSGASAADRGQSKLMAMQESNPRSLTADQHVPDKNNIETEQEMRKRLSQGVDKKMDNISGFQLVGSLENPYETHTRTAPMTNDEIESVIKDIREIKLLLFCRLLLAQASMLPAALRAGSVEEFLDDAELVDSDLRDICLKLEDPSLQEIRDACADFARGDDAEDDSVWNHASEKAMSRDGWLHFSIIAKDCDLKYAIELCRNWAEFTDLNLLTLWQYFPASNWTSWASNRLIQQLQELQFFPYFVDLDAERHTRHVQVGGRGKVRRQHDICEGRNIIVGHMKRGDLVTRRFLQYLTMRTGELLVLVRDGKTGRVITAPPNEHLWTYRSKSGIGRASKNEWQNVLEVGPAYFYMTDILREWRFSFDDYYDVFIWSFVPGQSPLDMYNVVISELRTAWRITHPREVYSHMEPLLRTLTREKDTMRTRKINPGEQVESLWDVVAGDAVEFCLFDVKDGKVNCRTTRELASSPYLFYNKANVAEDEVLFPDELVSPRDKVPFREIRNAINRLEAPMLPSEARDLEKGLQAICEGNDPSSVMDKATDRDEDTIWALPALWETGLRQVLGGTLSAEQRELLRKTGLDTINESQSLADRLESAEGLEIIERDRSFNFKEAFHEGDLEPRSNEKYSLVQELITSMLKTPHARKPDWVFYIAEIMSWLKIRADYDEYSNDPRAPWPHSFVVQDMVQAFVTMAMFFPESETAANVMKLFDQEKVGKVRNSAIFDPRERSKTLPNRRSRTSYKFRDPDIAVRPIVAKLYRAGIIAPAYLQNDPEIVPGVATAMTEPHRPDKLDLFICYEDPYKRFAPQFPPNFAGPNKWPKVLPHAEAFASKHQNARFALLRLWSAPHFYPLMVGLQNRQGNSFLDSVGRPFEWKFVNKDMPGSEFSIHLTVSSRLDVLKQQFGDRVVSRGDLILVMGEDAVDLMKYCTAVTFALQTKPWLREVDLWKSYINVGLDLLQELDPYWLD
ncbi:hypothetical protein HDV57DRAFT_509473 [Trichoderma longibrachiatum]